MEESRIAVIAILINNIDSAEEVNAVLHDYGPYIIGRMGIPYREKNVNIISVAVDAENDVINQIAGRLGKLDGVTAKAVCSKMPQEQ